MDTHRLTHILRSLVSGDRSVDSALSEILDLPAAPLADASGLVDIRIDHQRATRCGFPEVVFGEGKTPDQIVRAVTELSQRAQRILVTRVSDEGVAAVQSAFSDRPVSLKHHELARILELAHTDDRDSAAAASRESSSGLAANEPVGLVVVASGGTSDIPVAEEAAVTLTAMGARVERLYDVGVAGVHRALAHADILREARVVIAVAGMEGALPTLVAGLVDVPVVAVPTSVGYGANLDGFAPLLTMLNSCAGGIGVVNIDNGFGAAVLAARINNPSWTTEKD